MVPDDEFGDPLSLDDPPGAAHLQLRRLCRLRFLPSNATTCHGSPSAGIHTRYCAHHGWKESRTWNGWLWQTLLHAWWSAVPWCICPWECRWSPLWIEAKGRWKFKQSQTLSEVFCLPDTWDCVTGGGKEAVDYHHKCTLHCLSCRFDFCTIIPIVYYYTNKQILSIIFSDNSPSSDIEAARFSPTQGSFCSVQVIGAGTHQLVTKYTGLQRIYCNPFPAKSFYGSHRLDPVMIRPPWIDNGALLCRWKQFGMLEYCSCSSSQPLLKQTLGPSPSTALVSTMETCDDPENGYYMYYIIIIHVWNVLHVVCLLCLSNCFGRMVEVDWIPDCIGAWPQKAPTLCHPCTRAYPGKTSSGASWWHRNDSAPPKQLVSRRTWRPQAGWRWIGILCRKIQKCMHKLIYSWSWRKSRRRRLLLLVGKLLAADNHWCSSRHAGSSSS